MDVLNVLMCACVWKYIYNMCYTVYNLIFNIRLFSCIHTILHFGNELWYWWFKYKCLPVSQTTIVNNDYKEGTYSRPTKSPTVSCIRKYQIQYKCLYSENFISNKKLVVLHITDFWWNYHNILYQSLTQWSYAHKQLAYDKHCFLQRRD